MQFVGHVACWRHAAHIPATAEGIPGAFLTIWVTFVPSVLWIFLTAPWIEQLSRVQGFTTAMQALSAAVVGVIASLSFEFAGEMLFSEQQLLQVGPVKLRTPLWNSLRPDASAVAALGVILTFCFRAGPGVVLAGCVAAGLATRLVL